MVLSVNEMKKTFCFSEDDMTVEDLTQTLLVMYGVKCGQGHFLGLVCTMCIDFDIFSI